MLLLESLFSAPESLDTAYLKFSSLKHECFVMKSNSILRKAAHINDSSVVKFKPVFS